MVWQGNGEKEFIWFENRRGKYVSFLVCVVLVASIYTGLVTNYAGGSTMTHACPVVEPTTVKQPPRVLPLVSVTLGLSNNRLWSIIEPGVPISDRSPPGAPDLRSAPEVNFCDL